MVKASVPNFLQNTTSKHIPTATNNGMDYCAVLADPFDEYSNARIPDECNLPSRVVSLYQEGSFAVNSSGVGGIFVSLNKWGAIQSLQLESSLSTSGAIAFSAAATLPGANTLAASATRLVAAGVKIESFASDGYNGGTAYSSSRSRFEAPTNPLTDVTAFTTARMNGFGPLKYGCFSTYRPCDSNDADYVSATSVAGALQLHVDIGGAPPTSVPTPMFKYKVVVHYEILPAADTENGPGELAYGPRDGVASQVYDWIVSHIPSVGGGSVHASLSEMFGGFSEWAKNHYRTLIGTAAVAAVAYKKRRSIARGAGRVAGTIQGHAAPYVRAVRPYLNSGMRVVNTASRAVTNARRVARFGSMIRRSAAALTRRRSARIAARRGGLI